MSTRRRTVNGRKFNFNFNFNLNFNLNLNFNFNFNLGRTARFHQRQPRYDT